METCTLKAEILSAISTELDTWLSEQASIKDGHDYESRYMELTRKLNHTILMKTLGKQPGSRNKKNSKPVLASCM
jgi:hypothetical protein